MFSSEIRLLWSDTRAWELCRNLTKRHRAKGPWIVPEPIKSVCTSALKLIAQRRTAKNLDAFQIRKVIKGLLQSLSVCAVGLPEENPARSRVLVVIEQVGRRQEAATKMAKEVFQLTRREVEVVRHLLKGWANKEIAHELQVTEQTVKEHLQRIMTKTHSGSRTGILVRVLLL